MDKILEVNNLTVGFPIKNKLKYAVDDFSLDVYENDFVAIVGESGCGKTVATQTILGLQSPEAEIVSGSSMLDGVETINFTDKDWKELRSSIVATIFQSPQDALDPLVKVGKQIEEVLKIHTNMKKDERKKLVLETMEKCGLKDVENLYNKYPHQLSGGMQQRIVIATSIIRNPKILVADEPTTALDANIRGQIINLLEEIRKKYKAAIIFISHDLNLVKEVADSVVVMYAGKIVEKGSSAQIFSNPLHPYTEALLKAIPSFDRRNERLYNIKGSVTPLKDRAHIGCPFYQRCDHSMDICKESFPDVFIEEEHEVFCHLYDGGRNE